jgi:hypothetical protein
MGDKRSQNGEHEKYIHNFSLEKQTKRPLGGHRRRCQGNIKTDIGLEGTDCIHVTQD